MSHDYQPSWDYPCIELKEIEELTVSEREGIERAIELANQKLVPAMGFTEGIQVFFAESLGLSRINRETSVAVYCNGTSSLPVVGFDLSHMRAICEEEGLNLVHQFEISLAHELGHAYQEACGLDDEHDDGFNEDNAEQFGIRWVDFREIELWRLNPEKSRPEAGPMLAKDPAP